MKFTVIDNFLDNNILHEINSNIFSDKLEWKFSNSLTIEHRLIENNNNISAYAYLFNDLIKKLSCKYIFYASIKIIFESEDKFFFQDYYENLNTFNVKYYFNTCNGHTEIRGGPKILSKSNTIAFFKNLPHIETAPTDKPYKVILDMNLELNQ
tara:strand:+ start:3330 stop:3788 length:459 start_codon:yes stop_codon:yes gene_type:complete